MLGYVKPDHSLNSLYFTFGGGGQSGRIEGKKYGCLMEVK